MTSLPYLHAIVLAAGSGSRSGGAVPKQYRPLNGRSVLAHSVGAFLAHPAVTGVSVVITPGGEAEARAALGPFAEAVRLVAGGDARQASVHHALESLTQASEMPSHVLVHDSARPGLSAAVIDRLIRALEAGAQGAMPVLPVVDTLVTDAGSRSGPLVDRVPLRRVQTPQAFAFPVLLEAHRDRHRADDATDDAQMVRAGGTEIWLIEGDAGLEKITLPGDHERMERLLETSLIGRTGLGFDVHRLVEGKELWLCGVLIPHSHGLSGHSDADVAIHALVDALLGALSEGDIGSHFPPSDPQWRGARSERFLAFAVERIAARGGIVDHVDVTIICEAPKIGPHRDAMRAKLAQIMALPVHLISVKATTTERLGLTGRGEGIAAQAVASVRLPRAK